MGNKRVARFNWGVFDRASHAPQLRSCNYYVCTYCIHTLGHIRLEASTCDETYKLCCLCSQSNLFNVGIGIR